MKYLFYVFVICLVMGLQYAHAPTPYVFPKLLHFPSMPQNLENPVTNEGVELGRYLFYDPILSRDSTFSCASCHRQEVAFSDASHRFSKGIGGVLTERNVAPLFNLAWYPTMFWDGKAESIEAQALHPVRAHDEMDLGWEIATKRIRKSNFYPSLFEAAFGEKAIDSTLITYAIAQFERTLISHNSKYDQVLRGEQYFTPEEYKGFTLMNDQTKGDCLHCHTTDANALGTTGKFSNNGLDEAKHPREYPDIGRGGITGHSSENGLFKIPSLRNIGVTAPYMHDGRFATLEEVLAFYSEGVKISVNVDSKMGFAHQGGAKLTDKEKSNIIVFLHTLTDSTFLTHPDFGNPFTKKMNKK